MSTLVSRSINILLSGILFQTSRLFYTLIRQYATGISIEIFLTRVHFAFVKNQLTHMY
jgi:hypothetical protein